MSFDKLAEAYNAQQKAVIEAKWAVGVLERGLGNKSYGVIRTDIQGSEALVLSDLTQEVAQHIVDAHNTLIEGL